MDWRKRRNLEESYWWSAWNRQEWILCSYPFTIKRKALKGLGKISTSLPSSNKIKTHWCLQSHRKGKCLPLETLPSPGTAPRLSKSFHCWRKRKSMKELGFFWKAEAVWEVWGWCSATPKPLGRLRSCSLWHNQFGIFCCFVWLDACLLSRWLFFLADQGSMTIYRMINSSISIYWKSTKCPETSTNR